MVSYRTLIAIQLILSSENKNHAVMDHDFPANNSSVIKRSSIKQAIQERKEKLQYFTMAKWKILCERLLLSNLHGKNV